MHTTRPFCTTAPVSDRAATSRSVNGRPAVGFAGVGFRLFTTSVGGVSFTSYGYRPAAPPGAMSSRLFAQSRACVTGSTVHPVMTSTKNLNFFVFPSSAAEIRTVTPP